jgi:hypothetical protein
MDYYPNPLLTLVQERLRLVQAGVADLMGLLSSQLIITVCVKSLEKQKLKRSSDFHLHQVSDPSMYRTKT